MHLYKKATIISALGLLLPVAGMAATEAAAPTEGNSYNVTQMSLVGLMLILLFVIGMLANTLKQLAMVAREKVREERSKGGTAGKALMMLLIATLLSARTWAEAAAAEAEAKAPVSASVAGMAKSDFYLMAIILMLELVIIFALSYYIHVLLRVIRNKPEDAVVPVVKRSWFWDNFNSATAVEKEKDIMLDHDYDGIKELDNALPPWWKYGFYLTIFVGIIYIYRFHISHDGQSQEEEYTTEMEKGEADKAAYLAKSANNVDENTVTMLGADGIAAGKETFVKNCAACHVADGGGNVGPNLTDEYWLHGGSIKDVFKSIKYGWQDKGMKSWKDDLSPKQMQELTSFIRSLKGTKPANPKAPQGEIYIEAAGGGKTDSTKADSAKPAEAVTKK